MNKTKETFIFGFALFSAFFGAGNLILPPLLGFNAGPDWWLVAIGFMITTTVIPLFALLAHAKLQGTMFEFGLKISKHFSIIFCFIVYAIVIALPCPRTAAVTHEMVIEPFFNVNSLVTSITYFGLAFIFATNRNSVLNILGKYLTPIIILILLLIITLGLFSSPTEMRVSNLETPFVTGLLEGYQTYDAIAGVVTGGIIIISISKFKLNLSFAEKKKMIARSGLIAMAGLFIIYAGLIALGAYYNSAFDADISRTELLNGLATKTMGNLGASFLSVLVGLACFTTAVAIIVSVADFFKTYFNANKHAYLFTCVLCCVVGVLVGQMNVKYIIDVALPVLMFIYPICIVLIFLNVVPEQFASKKVFKIVTLIAFIFSIPDVLGFIIDQEKLEVINAIIPFANQNLGWVFPAIISFVIVNVYEKRRVNSN